MLLVGATEVDLFHTHIQTQTDRHIHTNTDRHTHSYKNTHTVRQTERQTVTNNSNNRYKHTCMVLVAPGSVPPPSPLFTTQTMG